MTSANLEFGTTSATACFNYLSNEIVNTVNGQVESCEATGEEAPPPPVVVFSTEVEIAEKDGGLRAGDDQDDEDKKQKSIP